MRNSRLDVIFTGLENLFYNTSLYPELSNIIELYNKMKILQAQGASAKVLKDHFLALKYMLKVFQQSIIDREDKYYPKGIEDVDKLFKVFIKLANKEHNEYCIKSFRAINIETNSKSLDDSKYSYIVVIAKRNILDKINNKKTYFRDEFSSELDKILETDSSCVLVTMNGDGIIVNPTNTDDLEKMDIITDGLVSNIDCYLKNDNLGKIVKLFISFYRENNIDVDNVDEDELYQMILNYEEKSK